MFLLEEPPKGHATLVAPVEQAGGTATEPKTWLGDKGAPFSFLPYSGVEVLGSMSPYKEIIPSTSKILGA